MLSKTHRLTVCLEKNALYLTAFLIPFLLMMVIFILQQIYPFGERSFLHIDMYHQYFPFLTEFYHKLKDGDSLLFSWNTGIGTNFIALFTYYLASPFNWLCVFVPEAYLIEFQSYLVVLKIGLCGFTSCYYFCNHFKIKSPLILFFSTFYALSGFMAAYNWNVMWLDVIFMAPIVILGLERLAEENRFKLYTISLAFCILSNFYISIMLCIYLVLYFLLILLPKAKEKLISCKNFAIFSLLAGGMAGVLLLPELAALGLSEFSGSSFPMDADSYFPILDVLARHSMDVAVEVGLDHWPNVYAGVAVLVLFPLYILCKSIPTKDKAGTVILLGFLIISFCSNTLSFLWHGFNYPNSLPSRQSYLYILLLLTVSLETFLHIKEFSKVELSRVFFGVIIFLVLCQKLVTDDAFTDRSFLLSAVFLTVYGFLLYLYRITGKVSRLFTFSFMLIFMLEAGLNTFLTSCSTVSRTSYLADYSSYGILRDRNYEEADFRRFERDKRITNNDGMLYGYPSASLFSSTMNGLITSFYEEYGLKSSKVFYSFDGATPLTASLLNVPYTISRKNTEDTSLSSLTDREGNLSLYKSKYSLPFGYVVGAFDLDLTEDIIEEEWEESLQENVEEPSEPSLYDLTEMFVDSEYAKDMVIDDDLSDIRFKNVPLANQNFLARQLGAAQDLFTPVKVNNGDTSSTVSITQNGYYYAYSLNSRATKATAHITGENNTKEQLIFDKMKNRHILDLGYRSVGDVITLTEENEKPLELVVYQLQEDIFLKLLESLNEQPLKITNFQSTVIDGTVDVKEPGYLILSMAYDPGWKVTVDSMVQEPRMLEGLFLCVPITEGFHTVTLTYYPQGLRAGIFLSLLSLAVFLAVCYISFSKERKSQSQLKETEDSKTEAVHQEPTSLEHQTNLHETGGLEHQTNHHETSGLE